MGQPLLVNLLATRRRMKAQERDLGLIEEAGESDLATICKRRS
jgi:hypothetical protein